MTSSDKFLIVNSRSGSTKIKVGSTIKYNNMKFVHIYAMIRTYDIYLAMALAPYSLAQILVISAMGDHYIHTGQPTKIQILDG